MAFVFPWYLALAIAISHALIDTRKPLIWWMNTVKGMSRQEPHAQTVEIWLDQVFHIVVLAVVALLFY